MLKQYARTVAAFCLLSLLLTAAMTAVAAESTDLNQRLARLEKELAGIRRGDELAVGREIYKAACMACHGINGDGNGPSATWLDPKPRDFTKGLFKWRTTAFGAPPTDADLERVIREGVSGSEMVPFGDILSKRSRMAVVQYVRSFSPQSSEAGPQSVPEPIVKFPLERPFPRTADSIAKGKELFAAKGCGACHGAEGDGNGPAGNNLMDAWGHPIRPWNFKLGYYKSGHTDQDLYRTITTGLNGTPMVAFGGATTEEERWQLVDFIRSRAASYGRLRRFLFVDEPTGRIYQPPSQQ